MVQHFPRPLARLQRKYIFRLTQNEPSDPKGPEDNLHYDDVLGDVLRPPQGTTRAAVKIS